MCVCFVGRGGDGGCQLGNTDGDGSVSCKCELCAKNAEIATANNRKETTNELRVARFYSEG